jgi:Flp pilus assembly protein TadB
MPSTTIRPDGISDRPPAWLRAIGATATSALAVTLAVGLVVWVLPPFAALGVLLFGWPVLVVIWVVTAVVLLRWRRSRRGETSSASSRG